MCPACEDKGIVRMAWTDSPEPGFLLCLCAAGMAWRNDQNNGKTTTPLWMVWCAKHQVPHEAVYLIEGVFTPEELREKGLIPPPSDASREAVLMSRKGKR